LNHRAKQINVFDFFTRLHFANNGARQACLDLLPEHMDGKNCQRVAQINHLIKPTVEKIFSLARTQFEAPRKRENSQNTAPKTPKPEGNYTPESPKKRMKSIR
jgi:hypothetical protein